MIDRHHHAQGGGGGHEGFDRELDLKTIFRFGAILAVIVVVVLIGMWGMSALFKSQQQAADPRPSPIPEANLRRLPPEPRLQVSPPRDMNEFRAREAALVGSYGWVDQRAGIARIPIDRAIDIVLEKGLPVPPPLPETAPAGGQGTASSPEAAGPAAADPAAAGPGAAAAPGPVAKPTRGKSGSRS